MHAAYVGYSAQYGKVLHVGGGLGITFFPKVLASGMNVDAGATTVIMRAASAVNMANFSLSMVVTFLD